MKMKKWRIDNASKSSIHRALLQKDQDILKFRHRWLLGDHGIIDGSAFPDWKKRVENECQNLRREIRILELEAYFDDLGVPLVPPILSMDLEGRLREQNWGDNLARVFAMEIRGLGKELKYPPEWDRILEHYVIYNVESYDLVFNRGIDISIRYRVNEDFGLISENVCLTLGENTGSEDLDGFWSKELKPFLLNLETRIKDKERKKKNASIHEDLIRIGVKKKDLQKIRKDPATGKKMRELDRDIATANMDDRKLDKLYRGISSKEEKKINKKLGKIVQNARYQMAKQRLRN